MTGVADGQVEDDAKEFAFVVVGDAALGAAIVAVALEPGAEAGLFRGLREVGGIASYLDANGAAGPRWGGRATTAS